MEMPPMKTAAHYRGRHATSSSGRLSSHRVEPSHCRNYVDKTCFALVSLKVVQRPTRRMFVPLSSLL
ncbi:hypothetical protein IG631_15205 [Alternaria alternata]|nr:hypothetical protein IG631_15205 [Alternaria alternata]